MKYSYIKKYLCIILFIITLPTFSIATDKNTREETPVLNIEELNLEELIFSRSTIHVLDNPYFIESPFNKQEIPTEKLSIIYNILSHTYESYSHQMRGADKNQVFSDEDTGAEIVFNENGEKVTDFNAGTFNFVNIKEAPIQHFLKDRLPWIQFGQSPLDPTYERERFYAYTQEFNLGVQSYILDGYDTTLKEINWNTLAPEEQKVYRYFAYLLFNRQFKITLSKENIKKLRKDSTFYYDYFNQVLYAGFNDEINQ